MNFHRLPEGNYPISVKYMPRGEDGDIYVGELRSWEDVVMVGPSVFPSLRSIVPLYSRFPRHFATQSPTTLFLNTPSLPPLPLPLPIVFPTSATPPGLHSRTILTDIKLLLSYTTQNGGVQFLNLYFLGDVQLGVKISKCVTLPK